MGAIDRIQSLLNSRPTDFEQAKSKGLKIVGYIPGGYFPEELVLAAGAIPVCMIQGGEHTAVEYAAEYVDRWLDTFCRAQIGYGISGEDPYYSMIDILFVPITDNNIRVISDTLDYFTDIEIFPMGVPHTKDAGGYRYYRHGLMKVKAKLEDFTGVKIEGQRLKEAVELCNKERSLLKEISLTRKNSTKISAKDFVMLNHASMLLDKTVFVEELESLADELKSNAPNAQNGPRILLTGSTLAMGDNVVLDLIEEAGGTVVIEDFAEGIKPYWTNVKSTGDPMDALAEAYFMDRIVPAWFRPGIERQKHLIQMVSDFDVSGVIWYQLMYREAYKLESYYFPEILKKETGLSMLTLESDYDLSETGQIRTRIETYIDGIRG